MNKKVVKAIISTLVVLALIVGGCSGAKPEAAEFEVSHIAITPSEVGPGGTVTVVADVRNVAEVEGSYKVPLLVNGAEVDSKEVWLGPGMTRTVTFRLERNQPGSYLVEIDGAKTTLVVREGLYRDTTYGFCFTYPKEWVKKETGTRAPVIAISAPEGLPLVQVFLDYLPEAMTPQEYALTVAAGLEEAVSELEVVSEGEIVLGDTQGYEQVLTWTDAQGTRWKSKLVFAVRGTQSFVIQAISTSADFDQHLETIDEVACSFRLEPPQPFGVAGQGSLVMFDIGPITLDPAVARETTSSAYIMEIFSGLVTFNQGLEVVPDIAERWEVSGDGCVYTFYLREGVRFHDGREVTASDFKYSLERACDPKTESPTAETYLGDIVGVEGKLKGEAEEISGVKVISRYTLEIRIDAPKAYFLCKLAHCPAFVVDRANVESGKEWWRSPNGTGPFRLNQWQKDELLILERNDLYYAEPAKLRYVVFRLWGGVPMRMYETGEIDIAHVSLYDIERVLDPANPLNKELVKVPMFSLWYIGFNTTVPPFDDPEIRQAFCHAVDKDKIIDLVLKGMAERADGILPPGMPAYNPELEGLGFDVDRARELIRESKYGAVSDLPTITFTASGRGTISDWNAALVDMWRQNLGVEVEIRQLEPEVYYQVLKEEKDQMFESGWVADYPDPQNFLDILFYTGSEENTGEYSNPDLDGLIEAARVEKDTARRMRMYQQIEQMLVEDAACLPLCFSIDYILVKPYIKGFVTAPMPIPWLRYVFVEPH